MIYDENYRFPKNMRDWYYGKEAYEAYGDLVAQNLKGKTVSKRSDHLYQSGGLRYEADQLGIDMYDLLACLEGMCHNRRAIEIDDSTYEILGSTRVKQYVVHSNGILCSISENDYSESVKGVAYKVFKIKNGKLYPPMVDNKGGVDTPIGVWLDAEEGEFAGLSATGRKQVKQRGGGSLAYRPGWHLGDEPRAKQFDRSYSWEFINSDNEQQDVVKNVQKYSTFISNYARPSNVGKVFYIKDIDSFVKVVDNNAPYFPFDFIWAECEYVMDINYQDEAYERGFWRTRKNKNTGEVEEYRSKSYQHSYGSLDHLPVNGYYKYRTNPNPDTIPWVITGAMKVNTLLDDFQVAQILGGNAPERQGGNLSMGDMAELFGI